MRIFHSLISVGGWVIVFLKIFILLGLLGVSAFAGTGGSEVNDWYNDISAALQGTWGKIIADRKSVV
mgnify:CR=1 FL=1